MIEIYIMQALLLTVILILSLRVLMIIHNTVNRCREEFAEVSELELLDPRPIRMPRTTDQPEDQVNIDESTSEAEVAADEDHINTV